MYLLYILFLFLRVSFLEINHINKYFIDLLLHLHLHNGSFTTTSAPLSFVLSSHPISPGKFTVIILGFLHLVKYDSQARIIVQIYSLNKFVIHQSLYLFPLMTMLQQSDTTLQCGNLVKLSTLLVPKPTTG